jgi:hypothetical protein
MNTGTDRSVRTRRFPPVFVDTFPSSGAPPPPRLWMKIPSKLWVRGCNASANVVR